MCGCHRNGGIECCRKDFVMERCWWEEELAGALVVESVHCMRLQTFLFEILHEDGLVKWIWVS